VGRSTIKIDGFVAGQKLSFVTTAEAWELVATRGCCRYRSMFVLLGLLDCGVSCAKEADETERDILIRGFFLRVGV